MRTLLAFLFVACLGVSAPAQNQTPIYNLARTNTVRETNWIAIVAHPNSTNGTRRISLGDLVTALQTFTNWSSVVVTNAQPPSTVLTNLSGTGGLSNLFSAINPLDATHFSIVFGNTNGSGRALPIIQGTNIVLYTNSSGLVINSQAGGAGGVINVANTIFVSTNGNDGTGMRERWDKPFLTPRAARAASLTNDTIVVFPGLYSDGVTNLLKNLLNWHFQAGAVLSNWNGGTIPMCIWDNTGFGTPGAVVSTITGDGVFIQRGGFDETAIIGLISTADPATRLSIECQKILASSDSDIFYIVAQHEGQITLNVKEEINAAYGPTETSSAVGPRTGGWWWGNTVYARGNVSTPKITTYKSSAFYSISSGPGDFFANVDFAYSTNAVAVWHEPTHSESKFWLNFKEIRGGSNMIARGTAVTLAGGKLYMTGQKISSFYDEALPLIGMTNGIAWIDIQKAEITNKSFFVEHHPPGGTLNLKCVDYFDLGPGLGARNYNFHFTGGTNNITGGYAVTTWGPGVKILDGEVAFRDFKINTSPTIRTSNHCFWVSGGNLVLDNCTAIPGGSNSVFASMARNIRVYGTLSTRSNVAPAITLLSGDLLVNESIDR